ncbi:MAG: HU family DNA-binding protein [Desulfohalobiaceae bacterium]|nr:HU family DNA-binding protein [Desulfohalobiaceae bacterium]
MTNYDFPDVCLSQTDEECTLTPPDLSLARERVHKLPEGFTKTMIKSLRMAFPDKFKDDEDAYMVFDAMKAIIAMRLANGNAVHLEGFGEFKTQQQGNTKRVVFNPEECLNKIC